MDATTAKSQAAGIGAGFGAALAAAICQGIFGQWPYLVGPPWEGIITGAVAAAVGAALAAYGAWKARNAMTVPQIAAAIQQGDVTPAAVVKAAESEKPAAAPKPAAPKPVAKPAAKGRK